MNECAFIKCTIDNFVLNYLQIKISWDLLLSLESAKVSTDTTSLQIFSVESPEGAVIYWFDRQFLFIKAFPNISQLCWCWFVRHRLIRMHSGVSQRTYRVVSGLRSVLAWEQCLWIDGKYQLYTRMFRLVYYHLFDIIMSQGLLSEIVCWLSRLRYRMQNLLRIVSRHRLSISSLFLNTFWIDFRYRVV